MGDRVTIDLLDGTGYQDLVQPGTGISVIGDLVGYQLPFHDPSVSKSIFIPTALIAQITVESSPEFDIPGIPHSH